MKGHNDEKTKWFKDMMKEVFKKKFEVEEKFLSNTDQCNNKRKQIPMK